MKGLEFDGSLKATETLNISANYTYTKTKDNDTGKELARRPKSQATFDIDWNFNSKGNLNISASYIGKRWDNSSNTRDMEAYTKVDLYSSYDLMENIRFFFKIDNLFDKAFQQIHGYAGAEASFYGGIKASF